VAATRHHDADPDGRRDLLIDAVLLASRALVGVAARSLASVDPDVTLPQYRALVILSRDEPQTLGALSEAIGLHPSSSTRLCDRLVSKGLIERSAATADRRETLIVLTSRGRDIVDQVTRNRRAEISRILARIPTAELEPLIVALRGFSDAAGEAPEPAWSLGWPTG